MNRSITVCAIFMVLTAGQAGASDSLELEPCINGSVSSSGLFTSQAEEDLYGAVTFDGLELARQELEPCINGEVSASGLFSSQVEEDLHKLVTQKLRFHGELGDTRME